VGHFHLGAEEADIIHLKLGHLSPVGVTSLINNKKLTGLPKTLGKLTPCHSCLISKFPKRKFPQLSTVNPQSRVLSTVSMDIMGPFRTTSRGGARYSLTIVDHHSRMTWARPVAKKSQVPQQIIGWASQARNLKETSIQVLRTDNGGEFINKAMSDWCMTQGILHQTSIPENPQQNGVALSRKL
jgi:transposase InsO family protein